MTLRAAAPSFAAAFFYSMALSVLLFSQACASSSVTGRVVDTRDKPVTGAKVTMDGESVRTNHQGFFHFPSMSSGRYNLRVEHPKFATSFKYADITDDKKSSLRIVLAPGAVKRFKSFRRANRVRTRRIELKVPANSLVDENGKPAKAGNLRFSVLDVRGRGLNAMPGRFVGRQADGKLVNLESVGAASLVFKSQGKKLQVKKGKKLVMLLPYQGKLGPGQKTVPMWYLDEKAGIWKNQGTGRIIFRKGKPWVRAELPHLSWWNCDQPWHNKTTILVRRIEFDTGEPVTGARISARGLDYNGYTYMKPARDEDGFCIELKPKSRVRLRALHYGANRAYEWEKTLRMPAGPSSCDRNPADGVVIEKIVFKKPKEQWACVRGRLDLDAIEDVPNVRPLGVRFRFITKFGNYMNGGIQGMDSDGNFCVDNAVVNTKIQVNSRLEHEKTTELRAQYAYVRNTTLNSPIRETPGASCADNPDDCQDLGLMKFFVHRFDVPEGEYGCHFVDLKRKNGRTIRGGCYFSPGGERGKGFERIILKNGRVVNGCVRAQDGNVLIICSPDDGITAIPKSQISQQMFR